MVWGGIAYGMTQLVIIQRNMMTVCYGDKVLQSHVVPVVQQQQWTLYIRPQVARVCLDFLVENNVPIMTSIQSRSVANLWDELSIRVRKSPKYPHSNVMQLMLHLTDEWNRIQLRRVNTPSNPIQKRIRATIVARRRHDFRE